MSETVFKPWCVSYHKQTTRNEARKPEYYETKAEAYAVAREYNRTNPDHGWNCVIAEVTNITYWSGEAMHKQLNAVVTYLPGNKCRTVTHTVVTFGLVEVAQATLGGRYSQEQALRELRTNPSRFSKCRGWDTAKEFGLVAI